MVQFHCKKHITQKSFIISGMQHLTSQCEQGFKENLEKGKTNTHSLIKIKSSISSDRVFENGVGNNISERINSIADINHINIFTECTNNYLLTFPRSKDCNRFIHELLVKNLIGSKKEIQCIHDEYINKYCHKNDAIHEIVIADSCLLIKPSPIEYTYFYLTEDGFNYFKNLSEEEKIKKTTHLFSLLQIIVCVISLVFVILTFAVSIIYQYK